MIHSPMKHYTVSVRKKVYKRLSKAPPEIQQLFDELTEDLEEHGPIQSTWKNFSKLEKNTYHCHLAYSWVACWRY